MSTRPCWAEQGIISQQDVDDIHKGLHSILDDLHSGALEIDPNAEDVHTFVEQTLTARVGDAGKRLHTGRSRNDQVALDIRLNLRDASRAHLQGQIKELITVHLRPGREERQRTSCPATPTCSVPSPSPSATS